MCFLPAIPEQTVLHLSLLAGFVSVWLATCPRREFIPHRPLCACCVPVLKSLFVASPRRTHSFIARLVPPLSSTRTRSAGDVAGLRPALLAASALLWIPSPQGARRARRDPARTMRRPSHDGHAAALADSCAYALGALSSGRACAVHAAALARVQPRVRAFAALCARQR